MKKLIITSIFLLFTTKVFACFDTGKQYYRHNINGFTRVPVKVENIDNGLKVNVVIPEKDLKSFMFLRVKSLTGDSICSQAPLQKEVGELGEVIYSIDIPEDYFRNNCVIDLEFSRAACFPRKYYINLNSFFTDQLTKIGLVKSVASGDEFVLEDGVRVVLNDVLVPMKDMNPVKHGQYKESTVKYKHYETTDFLSYKITTSKLNEIRERSTEYLRNWIEGKEVLLELGCLSYDKKGRLYANVFVKICDKNCSSLEITNDMVVVTKDDSKYLFLNASIVRQGYSLKKDHRWYQKSGRLMTASFFAMYPEYSEILRTEFKSAIENNKGLYKFDDMEFENQHTIYSDEGGGGFTMDPNNPVF